MTVTGQSDEGPLIYLIAGEPSGDQLGARLMRALRAETGGKVRFAGVGGQQMAAEGLESLFPIDELAVMGIVEIIPKIPMVYRRVKRIVRAVRALRPDALVTIDSPSFSLEVSERLKGADFPLIHYVAPSVWAWKAWRAKHIAKFLDHLLALLPFEPPYFQRHGLATTVVGHPVVEARNVATDPVAFRQRHGLPEDAPLVCVLPGSRRGEVKRHEPVFREALGLLAVRFPGLRAVTPTVPTVADRVSELAADWPVPALVLRAPAEKYQAFAACDAAMAVSGTVSVELCVAGLPSVACYRVGEMTAVIARMLLGIAHASIVNMTVGREVQPELLQDELRPETVAAWLERFMTDPAAAAQHRASCAEAAALLGAGDATPSEKAARTVLSLLGKERIG